MSTAKTSIGCLAEDYAKELAQICKIYLETEADVFKALSLEPTEEEQLLIDVAESFVKTVGDEH